jgi:hypothetical protein
MLLTIQWLAFVVWLLSADERAASPVQQSDELEVRLKDGTVRTGSPDSTTDTARLRLRFGEPDAYIVYGIDWEHVRELRAGRDTWSAEKFDDFRQHLSAQLKGADTAPMRPTDAPSATVRAERPPAAAQRQPRAVQPDERIHTRRLDSSARVTHIQVEQVSPYLVSPNWDADAAWDGVVVRVRPVDQWGRVVPVQGSLQATLLGDVGHFFGRGALGPESEPIREIGRWTRPLRISDYGPEGVVLRLEFQSYHPEPASASDPGWRIGPEGELQVRLAVPGHGVFHADATVRLRRFSPLRDQLLRSATRF